MTTVKRDPKEIAEAIREECAKKEETAEKMTQFVEAGWIWTGVKARKSMACGFVYARYIDGKFQVTFPDQTSDRLDTADDALKCVAEVEEALKQH